VKFIEVIKEGAKYPYEQFYSMQPSLQAFQFLVVQNPSAAVK